METILAILVGAIVGPIVTALAKHLRWLDAGLGAAINLALTAALYLGAWWISGADPAELERWMTFALAAAGLGQAGNNFWRKRMSYEARVERRFELGGRR